MVGSGLYASAGGVVVAPIQAFAPTLLAGTEIGGAIGASVVVTSAQGLIVWVTVCGLVSVVMVALGRYLKGVARRRDVEAFRIRRWYDERWLPAPGRSSSRIASDARVDRGTVVADAPRRRG